LYQQRFPRSHRFARRDKEEQGRSDRPASPCRYQLASEGLTKLEASERTANENQIKERAYMKDDEFRIDPISSVVNNKAPDSIQ
jgi:hypothetical protein